MRKLFDRLEILYSPDEPGAAPSAPATSAPEPTTSSGDNSFILPDSDDGDDLPLEILAPVEGGAQAPTQTPAPTVQSPVTPSPESLKAGPQAAPVVEAQPPTPQPAAPTTAPSQSPDLASAMPEEIIAQLRANQGAVVQGLATSLYALSPEEVDTLGENPQALISQMAAKVHFNTMIAAHDLVNRMVPVISEVLKTRESVANRVDALFAKDFPQIKGEELTNYTVGIARAYRAANPKISIEQLVKDVGEMVVKAKGLGVVAPVPAPAPTPAFSPALGGITPMNTPVIEDPFAGLGRDFD